MADQGEAVKLQRHLNLLREEYVKLQNKFFDLERRYNITLASSGKVADNSFVCRLLNFVSDLFDNDLYSDMTVRLDSCQIRAHRFVLAARSDTWGVTSLADVEVIDFTGIPYKVGSAMLKWVYTDQVDLRDGEVFVLELMTAASRYKLTALIDRCERALITNVNVNNCIKFYTTADEIGAETLRNHCSELISNHWDDFTSEDFAHMSAALLYKMFRTKTEFPLHTAIRMQREDVVFLYLIEFTTQLPAKLDETDGRGDLPVDLALVTNQISVAETLLKHGANVNARDKRGRTLLHKAILRADDVSATFLINNSASVNDTTAVNKETPLHLLATCFKSANGSLLTSERVKALTNVGKMLVQRGANANIQDSTGSTVLHSCMATNNDAIFQLLLDSDPLDLEKRNADDETVLWFALKSGGDGGSGDSASFNECSFAARLVKKGANVNATCLDTGDSLLHLSAKADNEEAGIFLVSNGANPNPTNKKGETPLHTACIRGLPRLSTALLRSGANPNLQTVSSGRLIGKVVETFQNDLDSDGVPAVYKQTPLHLAILSGHEEVIRVILEHKTYSQHTNDNRLIVPNFNVRDSQDQTALGLALLMGLHKVAQQLLSGGASINVMDTDGFSLLHHAILKQDTTGALFLLENAADPSLPTRDGETSLQLAVKRHLPRVVEVLCVKNVDMSVVDDSGNCPLWNALETGQEDVASILVRHKCDPDFWSEGPDGCYQTMLHRAIDENNEAVASFLIRSNCDVDSPRRPGPDGRGGEEAHDLQSPLHLAATWGLERIIQTLIEHNANVNAKDCEGKTPIHVAILNQHPAIIALLLSHPRLDLSLRDKQGLTPFAIAMVTKNNRAAQAILDREPGAAEQFDNKGRNFLHIAIQKSDIESVLFLISIHANVHSRIRDSFQLAPIHLAVQAGNEIVVRNLLLAGANVNDLNTLKQTPLHMAAAKDHATICSILLENGVEYNTIDENLNNALHLATQKGNIATVRVLLTESQINAEAINLKGQNPFHVLCHYGRENAAAIFDLFMECMPEYPINKPDAEGSSGLLLAYINGNGTLCRAVIKSGACLGVLNKHGVSIFNYQVATKQLLCRLLDFLSQEPPWAEGDVCLECGAKFGITTRKHHCRHCGRLLCSRCSDKDLPILKYNLNKPVRVCEICFDVLTLGTLS